MQAPMDSDVCTASQCWDLAGARGYDDKRAQRVCCLRHTNRWLRVFVQTLLSDEYEIAVTDGSRWAALRGPVATVRVRLRGVCPVPRGSDLRLLVTALDPWHLYPYRQPPMNWNEFQSMAADCSQASVVVEVSWSGRETAVLVRKMGQPLVARLTGTWEPLGQPDIFASPNAVTLVWAFDVGRALNGEQQAAAAERRAQASRTLLGVLERLEEQWR